MKPIGKTEITTQTETTKWHSLLLANASYSTSKGNIKIALISKNVVIDNN